MMASSFAALDILKFLGNFGQIQSLNTRIGIWSHDLHIEKQDYSLNPGIATEAVRLAVQKGFEDLDVNRIEAFVDPANVPSQRVLEKSGFEKEGLLRSSILQKGTVRNRFIYAILKS